MNQGIFGFPNSGDALSTASVNNQTGRVKVFSKTPGKYIGVTDMGRGTSGYQTGDGGYSEAWYGPYNHRLAAANTGVMVANRIYFNPYFFPYPTRIRAIGIQSGNTVTTGNMIMGIYETDEFGLPTISIYTTSTVAVAAGYGLNVVRNNSGLTAPLLGYYCFASIYDNTPTMSVCGSGNQGYGSEVYGSRGPLSGIASFGMHLNVGSFILPQSIIKQDLVFCDYSSNSPHTSKLDFGVVSQAGA
jgi:hypothetical protein